MRDILAAEGLLDDPFRLGHRTDTEAMFPDTPFLRANSRVTITLLAESPPTPVGKRVP